MTGPLLLDTHALVWWVAEPGLLSSVAAAAVRDADTVVVSAASAWELALLVAAGRIAVDRPVGAWFGEVLRRPRVRAAPVDAEVAIASVALGQRGFHGDPADRFLYATAARGRLPLVTRDTAITAFASQDRSVSVLW